MAGVGLIWQRSGPPKLSPVRGRFLGWFGSWDQNFCRCQEGPVPSEVRYDWDVVYEIPMHGVLRIDLMGGKDLESE